MFPKKSYYSVTNIRQSRPAQILLTDCVSCLNSGVLTYDIQALEWADTCVLVLPCGRSAHTEAGWLAGKGKRTIVYIPEMQEAELMYLLFDLVTDNLEEVVSFLK